MENTRNREIEIKLRWSSNLEEAQRIITESDFQISKPRVFERNVVLDTKDNKLRSAGQLLRIRSAGKDRVLTYKGPAEPGRHKSREEIELEISDSAQMGLICSRLGFESHFIYEKFRTEFKRCGEQGTVTLDETPIGPYLEIEGPPEWIDEVALKLGFQQSDYILDSYGALYFAYCEAKGEQPGNMTFQSRP